MSPPRTQGGWAGARREVGFGGGRLTGGRLRYARAIPPPLQPPPTSCASAPYACALGGWCPDPAHTPVRRRSISQCSLWCRRDSSLPETLRDSADGLSSCRVLAPLVIIESVLPIRFSAMRGANSESKVKGVGGGFLCETPHLGEIE